MTQQTFDKPGTRWVPSATRPPIFIVGVPRSGTTFLAAMLAAHSRLSCGPETRFFRFLAEADVDALLQPATWPAQAVDFLFATHLVDSPIPEHFALSEQQVTDYLGAREPSIAAILSALTEQQQLREGKARWVEKSPEHLPHVQTIRRYFPTSPIVRIVRDPRDVALSLRKTPWASDCFAENLLRWRTDDEQSADFFAHDSICYTLHYEALVESPAEELQALCTFLGEPFEPQMLDTSQSAAHVVTERDRWHRIVHKPADRSRSQVWQRELSAEENRLAEALVGDRLRAYGYPCREHFTHVATVFPSLRELLHHPDALQQLANHQVCFWCTVQEPSTQAQVYVGDPDGDRWFRRKHAKLTRLRNGTILMGRMCKSKLARERIYWVTNPQPATKRSYIGALLTLVLRLSAVPTG